MNEFEKAIQEIAGRWESKPTKEKQYKCPVCKDKGWIECTDELGREYVKDCECALMEKTMRLMRLSGLSEEFLQKDFSDYDTRGNEQLKNAKDKAMLYCENFKEIESTRYNSILFAGQVGSGKTHLGTAICKRLLNDGIPVMYMAYRNAVTKIKQHITDESSYRAEISRYASARVLYIDDLLKGKTTESDINILYEIVNYRYMNNMPIIISTEKTPNDLLVFDEAIGSRLIEMCRGNIIRLQGKELNYRLYS